MNKMRSVLLRLALEAGIGFFVACVILYIICVSSREATFVYQGF